jgi:S1-C subfamily serine protease
LEHRFSPFALEQAMTDKRKLLVQLSASLVERTFAAKAFTVGLRLEGAGLSGTLWSSDVLVTSEQSLPTRDSYEVRAADQPMINATAVGRDPGTNIAVLRLAQPMPFTATAIAEARAGQIALACAADDVGGATARLGIVHSVGPKWNSRAGGTIEQRVVLDVRLERAEEGGPVLDAEGALLGMSTFGPSGRVLVIPSATIARVLPQLLKDGRVVRGWLGVALQPVAVPDALREAAGTARAMMVMSLVDDGPGAKAGIMAGDILVSVAGQPASRFRYLAAALDAESVGRPLDVRLIRGGSVSSVTATITARPPT